MNICIFSPIYPSNESALGKFVHEQAKELAVKNRIFLITIANKNDKEYEVIDNVYVYRLKSSKIMLLIKFVKKFYYLNKKYKFNIFHSHFVGFSTLIFGITSKVFRIPYVVSVHGMELISNNRLSFLMKKLCMSFPDRIICVSRYVALMAKKYVSNKKLVFIPNGVDVEKLKPNKNRNKFKKELNIKYEKILLSICNLVERKGLDIVIKAFHQASQKIPNIVYFIIGKGPEKENLVNLVKQLNLSDKVRFINYVSDEDLANFYNICDIFVLMSRTIREKAGIEGFGVVYIEASYFGKPVIGGKSGGTADSIINEVTGYRIEPTNQKELSNKIIKLLKDASLRKKLGNNGKKRVKTKLLWKHNIDKLIKIYQSLIKVQEAINL